MPTENNDNDSTQTVVKTRKPRSPNRPKTVDKQVELVQKKLNRLVGKQQAASEAAVERVKVRFAETRQELFESLVPEVRAQVDPDFELPVVTNATDIVDAVEPEETAAE